jgi:Ca2+-binding RTX toxin-like protein
LVAGDRIYLGGYFTHVDGVERNHLAAINAATGELTNWDPNANGSVRTLALSDDGTRIYAGGTFSSVSGVTRRRLVSLDAATGAVDPSWKPTANSAVRTLAVSGSSVYLGGDFTTVKGENRTRLALVDGVAGDLDESWVPTANRVVRSLALSDDGARVYVGGDFTVISGESRPNLAALDPTTGALDNAFMPPPPNGKVYDLKESGGRVYTAEGGPGGAAAAYDSATGAGAWAIKGNGDAEAVAVLGSTLYVGGHFERFDGQDRNKFAALDALTGALDPDWTPIGGRGAAACSAWIPSTCNAHVFELRADPQSGRLYAGGDFRRISGASQAGFAQFSEQTPCTMTGTSNNDLLEGTLADDVICGGKGNDTIKGLGGNDTLKGEGGSDKLYGGEGDDTLDGGLSTDTANFSESAAAVTASLVDNTATGEGSDTLVGIENLTGSASNDALSGSEANNSLSGSGGADTIDGLGGNDTLTGGGQNDTVWGGSGDDSVVGSGGADNLFGDDGDDRLDSQDGVLNDSLDGGADVMGDTCLVDATELSVVDCEL